MDKKLVAYRKKIDTIDDHIFDLLHKRMLLVKKIWQYKKKIKLPLRDRQRETHMITRAIKRTALPPSFVHRIYDAIFILLQQS